MTTDYAYSDLTLHGRFRPGGDFFDLFVLLNGVEVPVQTLSVADYREKFQDAEAGTPAEPTQPEQQ